MPKRPHCIFYINFPEIHFLLTNCTKISLLLMILLYKLILFFNMIYLFMPFFTKLILSKCHFILPQIHFYFYHPPTLIL